MSNTQSIKPATGATGGKRAKSWDFHNVHGEVMFTLQGRSHKDALQLHVRKQKEAMTGVIGARQRVDLRGIFLDGLELSGIDLSRCDLTGAVVKDCRMRHANLNDTVFRKATVVDSDLDCVESYRSNWVHSRVEKSSFQCGTLNGSTLYGAILKNLTMTGVLASGVDFSHTLIRDCRIPDGKLVGSMFGGSRIYRCDLSGADLSDSRGQLALDSRSGDVSGLVRNRTLGARFVGNTYSEGTKYNDLSLPALKSDRRVSRLSRNAIFFPLACAGMMYGEKAFDSLGEGARAVVEHMSPLMSPGLSHALHTAASSSLGHAAGVGLAIGAAYFVKEVIPEKVKDPIFENLLKFWTMVRDYIGLCVSQGQRMVDLVVLMGRNRSMEPLRQVMDARKRPSTSAVENFKTFASRDFGDVIVCTRNHLAQALSATSAARKGLHSADCDLTILHAHSNDSKTPASHGPCVINIMRDGRMSAVWADVGRHPYVRVEYSEGPHSTPKGVYDPRGLPVMPSECPPEVLDKRSATLFRFEKVLTNDVSLDDGNVLKYNMSTHFVAEGGDGTIIVRRTSDRAIDNDLGPAVVRKDGSALFVIGDKAISREAFREATVKRPGRQKPQPSPPETSDDAMPSTKLAPSFS